MPACEGGNLSKNRPELIEQLTHKGNRQAPLGSQRSLIQPVQQIEQTVHVSRATPQQILGHLVPHFESSTMRT